MTAFVNLFVGVLDSNTHKVNTADVLGGKVVGIYFGANWCPECRAFTQYLRDYYNHQKAEAMELVFVSLDENQRAFQSHYATMPWKALPFVDKGRKVSLRNRFVVNGHNIPKLVILDQKGLIIHDDGSVVCRCPAPTGGVCSQNALSPVFCGASRYALWILVHQMAVPTAVTSLAHAVYFRKRGLIPLPTVTSKPMW
jgi:thiol-disulfide isomerase/thioredoxin